MPILDLQRRITEAGRIRTGRQVDAGQGKTRPEKLETFRFTSSDRRRIEQLATLYGGTVEPWAAPAGPQWQVICERAEIDIIVPPTDLGFSQHFELWSAGGCQRRCDGATESITEGACLCNPEDRECDIHTRLSVMLRDVPGLGLWRLDTQGWYAAQELIGAVEVLQVAAGRGALLPARLRLDQRQVKRPDKNGRVVTRRFAVPVIDIEITPAQLLAGGQGQPLQQIEGPVRAPLTPVPLLAAPVPSIAEQSAAPAARPKRANAAAEIPPSGRTRATTSRAPEPPADDPTDVFAADEPGEEPEAAAPSLRDELLAEVAKADSAHADSPANDDQRDALAQLLGPIGGPAIFAGVRAIWPQAIGEDKRAHLSQAEAAAVLVVGERMGVAPFREAWKLMATELIETAA